MSQKIAHRLIESEVVLEFPIADSVPGWFFRIRERSAGCYIAEGTDLCGRTVSASGGDDALDKCIQAAMAINKDIGSGTKI